jgi:hypothetical protein
MSWNAENIIGKKICVGIVYLDREGNISDRVQNHGTVLQADDLTIEYKLADQEDTFTVPAYYDNLETADPEVVYILEDSGEKVDKVDIVATYTVVPLLPHDLRRPTRKAKSRAK